MTNGRIRRACPLPRSYGPCGEPTAFARLGAALLEHQAAKEALAKLRRESREADERAELRYQHEWRQSSQGWDATALPCSSAPPSRPGRAPLACSSARDEGSWA